MSRIERRIHLFNSLNWASYNLDTLGFLNNNQESLITIATDMLSIRWDSKYTWNAVLLGETDDVDEFVLKIGCIGHNHQVISHPRAFLYYTHSTLAKAQLVNEQYHEGGGHRAVPKGKTDSDMDLSMAHLPTALCINDELDLLFDNPAEDPVCLCRMCIQNPPLQWLLTCNCSGQACAPEILEESSAVMQQVASGKT
jgi:hypothetical protein